MSQLKVVRQKERTDPPHMLAIAIRMVTVLSIDAILSLVSIHKVYNAHKNAIEIESYNETYKRFKTQIPKQYIFVFFGSYRIVVQNSLESSMDSMT
eukprot:2795192-Amphidinium_carterae.1